MRLLLIAMVLSTSGCIRKPCSRCPDAAGTWALTYSPEDPRLGDCAALGLAPVPFLQLTVGAGTLHATVGEVPMDGPLYENGDFDLKGAIWSPDAGSTSLRYLGRLTDRAGRRLEGRYSQVANRPSGGDCSESWEFVGAPQ